MNHLYDVRRWGGWVSRLPGGGWGQFGRGPSNNTGTGINRENKHWIGFEMDSMWKQQLGRGGGGRAWLTPGTARRRVGGKRETEPTVMSEREGGTGRGRDIKQRRDSAFSSRLSTQR